MNTGQFDAAVRGWLRERLEKLRPAAGVAKVRVAVVTDSAAALPPEWVTGQHDGGRLTIVPMPVLIGDEIFGEGDEELEANISLQLAAGGSVKTSRPSPGQFERAYVRAAAAGFDAVVSIHISAKLSGTVEAARLAAVRATIPVLVVDTGLAGMAEGFAVQTAVAAARAGASQEDVAAMTRTTAASARILFYVPSLDQLRRGGRIGAASNWLGSVFAIKPILAIRDGAVVPLEKIRTAVRAVARLEELACQEVAARDPASVRVAIHHFGNEEQAQEVAVRLQEKCPGLDAVVMSRLPAVLAAHAGLGVLAVCVTGPTAALPAEAGPFSDPEHQA